MIPDMEFWKKLEASIMTPNFQVTKILWPTENANFLSNICQHPEKYCVSVYTFHAITLAFILLMEVVGAKFSIIQ